MKGKKRIHRPVVWTISEECLLVLLRRAHSGESPDALYVELYANSRGEVVDPSDSPGGDG